MSDPIVETLRRAGRRHHLRPSPRDDRASIGAAAAERGAGTAAISRIELACRLDAAAGDRRLPRAPRSAARAVGMARLPEPCAVVRRLRPSATLAKSRRRLSRNRCSGARQLAFLAKHGERGAEARDRRRQLVGPVRRRDEAAETAIHIDAIDEQR